MIKFILLLFFSWSIVPLSAQISLFYNGKSFRVSQTSIIKDSASKTYSYPQCLELLSSGVFDIRPENPGDKNTGFILFRLSPEEQKSKLKSAPKPVESKAFKGKKKIIPFSAKDMDNVWVDTRSLSGKILVLNFWFINCLPCRAERPYLNLLADDYAADSNIVFLAVALDKKSDLEKFLKENPFRYRVVPEGMRIADQNRIEQYPTHVILDQEGNIYFNTVSYNAVTGYWMRKSIDELRN